LIIDGSVFSLCWSALVGPDHHSAEKATTRPNKVLILTLKLWKLDLFDEFD
jgi:hypothetical protein